MRLVIKLNPVFVIAILYRANKTFPHVWVTRTVSKKQLIYNRNSTPNNLFYCSLFSVYYVYL